MLWIAGIVIALVISFVILYLFLQEKDRGTDWRKVGFYFVVMIAGIFARALYDMLTSGENFDSTGLMIALVVSPITFGFVYTQVSDIQADPNVATLTLMFQNGFFWSSIFGAIGPSTAGA